MKLTFDVIFLVLSFLVFLISIFVLVRDMRIIERVLINLLLMVLSFDVMITMYVETDLWAVYPALLFSNWQLQFLTGPLLYLSVLIKFSDTRLRPIHFSYFIPFAFMLSVAVPTLFSSSGYKFGLYAEMEKYDFKYLTNDIEWVFHSTYTFMFIVLSYFTLKNIENKKLQVLYNKTAKVLFFIMVTGLLQIVYLVIFFSTDALFQQNNLYIKILWTGIVYMWILFLKYNKKRITIN